MSADPADELRRFLAAHAPVPPDARQVREAAGYDERAIAVLFHVTPALVAAWDDGSKAPTVVQRLALRSLTDVLRGAGDRLVADLERYLSDPSAGTTGRPSGG
jgi:hypothetical protein